VRLYLLLLTICFAVCYADELPQCDQLYYGQYSCILPNISSVTYEYESCSTENTVFATCFALEGVECDGDKNWTITVPCRYTNGYYFSTALGLSLFAGICGIDRFYLGYPAIGLLKLLTFGGFLVGNWIDIILISTQVLKPADGSNYIIPTHGPKVTQFGINNQTYIQPPSLDYDL